MGDIGFELCDKSFVAVEQTGPKGSPMWRYPEIDDEEHRETEPLASELPESILIAGSEHQFAVVTKKDGSPKPFGKTREVKTESDVDDKPVKIHCRVTKRRNGKWYFWLHINPSRATSTRESRSRPEGHTTAESSNATDQLSSILEIFDKSDD